MNTYEVLLGAISKRFNTIVEFTAFEDFNSFDRKGKMTLHIGKDYYRNLNLQKVLKENFKQFYLKFNTLVLLSRRND